MFSKGKKRRGSQPDEAKETVLSGNGNGRKGARMAPSIISADMTVNGSLTAGGDIQVDGIVDGDITTHALTVGETATVRGEVVCEEAVVRGRVIGSLRANKILLCSTAHVEGDILHNALAVEAGAFFEGNCRHSEDPLNEVSDDLAIEPLGSDASDVAGEPDFSSSDSTYDAEEYGSPVDGADRYQDRVKPVLLGTPSSVEAKPAVAGLSQAPTLKSMMGSEAEAASDTAPTSVRAALKRLTGLNGKVAETKADLD